MAEDRRCNKSLASMECGTGPHKGRIDDTANIPDNRMHATPLYLFII